MKNRRSNTSRGSHLRGSIPEPTPALPGTEPHVAHELSTLPSLKAGSDPVLRIDRPYNGPIHYPGAVLVGPDGQVTGNICAAEVFIEGSVRGNVRASRSLRIASSANVVGDMRSPRVSVARGAQLRGSIGTRGGTGLPSDLDDSAVDTLLSAGGAA